MIKVCVIQTFFCKNQLIVIFVINRNYSVILATLQITSYALGV